MFKAKMQGQKIDDSNIKDEANSLCDDSEEIG